MNQTIKILVVDDDPDVLFATARVLRKENYEVVEASTGRECISKAKENKPDLILLDVMLPDIEGTEICKQIKADPFFEGTLVVLLSGFKVASDDQASGLDTGADGYIARPISNIELSARVRAMARIRIAERKANLLVAELKEALAKVKTLSGLLPICSHCKSIRDGSGYWNQVEAYLIKHSDAKFSHGICQKCAEKYYPDMGLYDDEA